MKRNGQNFFVILDRFLPFYLPNNLKKQNFEKLKITPGDIIILHKCTKNHDHMLQCSLDIMAQEIKYLHALIFVQVKWFRAHVRTRKITCA